MFGRRRVLTKPVPRLMSQLFESEIFIQIGDRHFQIPRDIFSSPGDSPNFFTLGFGAFFASPSEVFPGLDRVGLLRPPAIVPPAVPHRSAEVFAELLHLLRGYPLHIRNEDHRAELLRDCRYFHLRGLEQKLIPHQIAVNPFTKRTEIVLRLEDVRPSGIAHFALDANPGSAAGRVVVTYARPFVDDQLADLIIEIAGDSTLLDQASQRADFVGMTRARMASLLQVVGRRMDPPDSQLGIFPIQYRMDRETDLTIDGKSDSPHFTNARTENEPEDAPPAKRARLDDSGAGPSIVRKGQWRLQVQTNADGAHVVVLIAIKLDVYTTPRVRNQTRRFL